MKHNKYILALAFASMLTLGSCGDDFLGKEPQGVLTPEALANAQGVELLVTSAYAGLASPVEGYDPYQASPFNWVWGGIYGGDANKGSDPNDQSTVNEIELYNTLSTNGYIKQKWVWVYQMSKRVNLALQVLYNPQIQISAESETKRSIFREKDKTKRSKKESAQHSKSRNKSFVMTSVSAL